MADILIESHYLPSIHYMSLVARSDGVLVDRHAHFVKQTFRNRCYINTAQGLHKLIVPLYGKKNNVPLKEIHIDYQQQWQNNHWRSIESAYRKAPFFEHYEGDLKKIFDAQPVFLADLNFSILENFIRWFGLKSHLSQTLSYDKLPPPTVADYRDTILPQKKSENDTTTDYVAYQQVFGRSSGINLSVIDLLFCEGPHAGRYLYNFGKTGTKGPGLAF